MSILKLSLIGSVFWLFGNASFASVGSITLVCTECSAAPSSYYISAQEFAFQTNDGKTHLLAPQPNDPVTLPANKKLPISSEMLLIALRVESGKMILTEDIVSVNIKLTWNGKQYWAPEPIPLTYYGGNFHGDKDLTVNMAPK